MSKEVTAITMQKGIIDRLDRFLETNESREMGLTSRPQVVTMILRDFLQDMEEKITAKKNFGMGNLEFLDVIKNKIRIKDKEREMLVIIGIKNNEIYCNHCNAETCTHTQFLLSVVSSGELIRSMNAKLPEKLENLMKFLNY